MFSDWLKVKLSTTDEHCELQTAGSWVPGRNTAGASFILAREGTASYCDEYLLAHRFLGVSVTLGFPKMVYLEVIGLLGLVKGYWAAAVQR